jgi:hypothetical protein
VLNRVLDQISYNLLDPHLIDDQRIVIFRVSNDLDSNIEHFALNIEHINYRLDDVRNQVIQF